MARTSAIRLGAVLLLPAVACVAMLLALRSAESGDAVGASLSGTPDENVVAYLAAQRRALDIPGMEVAIVRGGAVSALWAEGDSAPGREISTQTPVQLASLTKGLTAIAVMQLVGAGDLDLENPVVAYLPWFRTADKEASDTITVRQLLHHTSGLQAWLGDNFPHPNDQEPSGLERGVREMADSDLAAPPGTQFLYSDANYNVLGAIIEAVSGQPYAAYMQDHVFAALDMTHTFADPVAAELDGAARGYYRWFGLRYRPADLPQPSSHLPSAVTFSSAEDMARELLVLLGSGTADGEQVLAPDLVSELLTPGADADGFSGYAMGWFVRPLWESVDPTTYAGDDTSLPLVYEHTGNRATVTTFAGFIPAEGVGVVVLMNSHDPEAASRVYALQGNVWRILLGDQPVPLGKATEPFLDHYAPVIGVTLLAAQVSLFLWTVGEIRRRRRSGRARRWSILVAALVADLLVLAFLWLFVPLAVDAPVTLILALAPDVRLVFLFASAIVVLWAPLRTWLLWRHLEQP
jgi:CubicO group peptidase (beta-lactamase class C family)